MPARQRDADDVFEAEESSYKTETELTRFVVCVVLQHCRVRGMGSQTMNSVSGLKQAPMVTSRNPKLG